MTARQKKNPEAAEAEIERSASPNRPAQELAPAIPAANQMVEPHDVFVRKRAP